MASSSPGMHRILDCHTASAAFESLTGIFRIDSHALAAILDDYVIEDEFPEGPQEPAEQLLYRVLRESGGAPSFDSTHWFHATRVMNATVFQRGLLPLGHLIDTIWNNVYGLAPASVCRPSLDELRLWMENDGGGHFGNLYRLKTEDQRHWGPFAFLVRDAILDATRARHHNYLGIPEIVEDIATCAKDRFGWDLATAYREATTPFIVKFSERGGALLSVRSALYYVYCHRKGFGQSTMTNTCFDAAASPIEVDRILAIERVIDAPCLDRD